MFKKIKIFHDLEVEKNAVTAAGEAFPVALYNGSFEKNALDALCYQHFTKSVSTNKYNLVLLPPISNVASEDCLRVYHKVPMWCRRYKDPKQYGWQKTWTTLDAAPGNVT